MFRSVNIPCIWISKRHSGFTCDYRQFLGFRFPRREFTTSASVNHYYSVSPLSVDSVSFAKWHSSSSSSSTTMIPFHKPYYSKHCIIQTRTITSKIPSDDEDDEDDEGLEEEVVGQDTVVHSDSSSQSPRLRDLRPLLEAQLRNSEEGDDFTSLEMNLLKALHKRNPADRRSLVRLRKAYEAMFYWDYAIATQKDIIDAIPLAQQQEEPLDQAHQLVILGNLHMRNMQVLEASTIYQKALRMLQNLSNTSFDSTKYPKSAVPLAIGKCLVAMAGVQFQRNRIEDAMSILKTAATQYLPHASQEYLQCLQHQGLLHRSMAEYALALEIYQRAENMLTKLDQYSRELHRNLRLDIADMHLALEQLEPALTIYQDLLQKCRASAASDEPQEAVLLHNIGKIHAQQGQYEKAAEELEMSISMKRRFGDGDTNPELAKSLNVLGAVQAVLGSKYEALQCFKESLFIMRANFDDDRDPNILYAMRNIAVLQGDKVPKWEEEEGEKEGEKETMQQGSKISEEETANTQQKE